MVCVCHVTLSDFKQIYIFFYSWSRLLYIATVRKGNHLDVLVAGSCSKALARVHSKNSECVYREWAWSKKFRAH